MPRPASSSGDENHKAEKDKKSLELLETLVTPTSIRLSKTAPRCDPSEYLIDPTLRSMTKRTRGIVGRSIPLKWQHTFRDDGGFRWLADSLVTSFAVPAAAVMNPSAIKEYIKLTTQNNFQRLYYGKKDNANSDNSYNKSSQFIDVFFPNSNSSGSAKPKVRGMIFFVHGGAWGSGMPWMYRLIARPFLELGLAVAIVGYRVYPLCGVPVSNSSTSNQNSNKNSNSNSNSNTNRTSNDHGGVLTQVDDLESAFHRLVEEYPQWCIRDNEDRSINTTNTNININTTPPRKEDEKEEDHQQQTNHLIHPYLHPHHLPHLGMIVIGHSSGAHISLLWLVERAERQIGIRIKRQQQSEQTKDPQSTPTATKIKINAFIGISGVYNINHHFDYEAGRGVEEISPLKPANGYNRKSFLQYTPHWKIQHELLRNVIEEEETRTDLHCNSSSLSSPSLSLCFPERFLLVHGVEDDVVPFPSTSEAARMIKQCLGGCRSDINNSNSCDGDDNVIIDEYYVPKTGHQDTVVDLMLGEGGPVTTNVVEWLLKPQRQRQRQRQQRRSSTPTTILSKL